MWQEIHSYKSLAVTALLNLSMVLTCNLYWIIVGMANGWLQAEARKLRALVDRLRHAAVVHNAISRYSRRQVHLFCSHLLSLKKIMWVLPWCYLLVWHDCRHFVTDGMMAKVVYPLSRFSFGYYRRPSLAGCTWQPLRSVV